MKKIFALMLAMIMSVSVVGCGGEINSDAGGTAQQDDKQDKVTVKEIKNPVRSELYDESGTILADITYEYDAEGRRVSNTTSWNYDFGEGWEKDTYTYNDNGDVLTKTMTYDYSDYAYVISYEYDADGRLIKEAHGDGSYGTKYVYGDDGKLAECYSYNNDTETLAATYSYAHNAVVETSESGDNIYTYATFYDDEGKILKWEYAWNGQPTRTHNYTYDADGNLARQDVSIESWKMEGYVLHYYE